MTITTSTAAGCTLLLSLLMAGCAGEHKGPVQETTVQEMQLSNYSDAKPQRTMRLLFIHHSCGGQWLAQRGSVKEIVPDSCVLLSHPNGGGLRTLLQHNNYEVHEAAYKSSLGEKTDVCDWNRKFRDNMAAILSCNQQDAFYRDAGEKNDIVVFKSCFPANNILSDGEEPGDPDSPVHSTANYRAAYRSILNYFAAHPDTLFVCVTAPALAQNVPSRTLEGVKNLLGSKDSVQAVGERARRFNNWLKDSANGWLKGYGGKNVVVFDYYDVLTRHGKSNYSLYATGGGKDSHPSAEGNALASTEFIPFLNKAVHRLAARR